MSTIKRIYIEKKINCDIYSANLFIDLKQNLQIENLEGVRLLNLYDIEGMDSIEFEKCKSIVFYEPPIDNIYEENFPLSSQETYFISKYLPGQYDQRADSAMQCVQIVTGRDNIKIENSKVYVLKGRLSKTDIDKIKKYCINPVDSMETLIEKPTSLGNEHARSEDIKIHKGFIDKDESEILKMRKELGLAMSDEDLLFCQQYFKNDERRNPTFTELKVIDTYWSDHCRHTTFLTEIRNVIFQNGFYKNIFQQAYNLYLEERKSVYKTSEKDICLMDIAVMGMKSLKQKDILNNLDESDEINACSIVINVDVDGRDEQWYLMFKNETHNHPTEIEPFGGAATCLGGAIRDPLSGRSYVYQAMRVTGSGNPTEPIENTLSGKLPQIKITKEAAHGYSSYGNQIGLATGLVSEIYHQGYVAKRLEVGAVIGAVKRENVVRNVPIKGDIIILVGGQTGRDGCGGATGSSKEHSEQSILTCGAEVQKGNAPTERKLQRLFRNPKVSKLIKRCNDFGAGGISVAIGELADSLYIDLNKVPKKYEGLDGTELAISESQERMAVVVAKENAESFIKYSQRENLLAVEVAQVTDNGRLIMNYATKDIVNLSRDFLNTNGAKQSTNVVVAIPEKIEKELCDLSDFCHDNLSALNVCAQKGLVERFDSSIGNGTVLMPFGGVNQLTPIEAMVAKIPLENGNTNTVSLMSYGFNPNISSWSPFHGAIYAVVESISKIVASGGNSKTVRLTFQEYFEKLGTDPMRWGKPFIALLGAFYAQIKLEVPAIGGKDSMSGTFNCMDVPPTLISFAVDVSKADNIISPEFKKVKSLIIKLDTNYDENDLPKFDELIKNYELVQKLINDKKVISAHTIGVGGVAAVLFKMAFGNNIGAEINCADLYNPNYGSFILEVSLDKEQAISIFKNYSYEVLGTTTDVPVISLNGNKIKLEEALTSWLKPLEKVFPTELLKQDNQENLEIKTYSVTIKEKSKSKIAKPKVFIPVFPGTNCEIDTKKAFEQAGANVEQFVIRNLNVSMLQDSIKEMEKIIKDCQMIAIPGGFSAGDEPDGSGKFIAAVFRNPYIKDVVMDLLKNRDGLMIGICNGFQALIKLGLLPYGEIGPINENSPTLTYNAIGRHVSSIVRTKIVSNSSPWLYNVKVGDIHTVPVSHGEGRLVANEDTLNSLINNHQIVTQYVDLQGNPTYSIKHNPNGSLHAVEGLVSLDGRVLGKMCHSERVGDNLYKNVAGNYDQKIFKSGVEYFL